MKILSMSLLLIQMQIITDITDTDSDANYQYH